MLTKCFSTVNLTDIYFVIASLVCTTDRQLKQKD